MTERARLETFLCALDASPRALRHWDRYGDWCIAGRSGQIFADGAGWLIVVNTAESPRRWTGIKRRLTFCRVTQDGDDEGCLHLDRLPTAAEAALIREAIGVRKRLHHSPEALARMAVTAFGRPPEKASSADFIRRNAEGLAVPHD
jgi:hypothetical protein